MQAKFYTFVLCLLSLTMFSQPPMPEGEPGKDYNVTGENGKQGPWIRVHENGSIYYTGQFKNDKPYGVFKYYFDSGELMARHEFVEDHTKVQAEIYYKNGALQSEGIYINQKKDSVWNFYNRDDDLLRKESYKNDLLDGPTKVYYSSGELLEESTYENDKREGDWKMYYDNGNVKIDGESKNDKHHGEFVFYFENGKKEFEGRYEEGLQQGQWIEYHKDGRIKIIVLYENGKIKEKREMNGVFMDYYITDIPKSEYRYKDGKKHGVFTEWYDKGEFKRIQTKSDGPGNEMQWREKLVGQQVKLEGEYRNGEPDGEFNYYNEDGKLIKTEVYEGGELLETIEN